MGKPQPISDPQVMSWIESSATALGLSSQRMPSGAECAPSLAAGFT
jgi:hypothetical protein